MKKLLVLALVLSMAGIANAAMEFTFSDSTVAQGSSITFDISNPGAEIAGGAYFIAIINAASTGGATIDFTNAVLTYPGEGSQFTLLNPADDPDSAAFWQTTQEYIMAEFIDQVSPISPVMGSLATGLGFNGVSAGDVVVRAWDASGESYIDYTITVTPEPVTVGLLGLGALFLRRRK